MNAVPHPYRLQLAIGWATQSEDDNRPRTHDNPVPPRETAAVVLQPHRGVILFLFHSNIAINPMRSAIAVIMFALPLLASDPYEQELSTALVNHLVVLRNFYTDAHLKFDSDGKLTSKGTPGFGPIEGRIYIQEIKLEPPRLTIHGSRPVAFTMKQPRACTRPTSTSTFLSKWTCLARRRQSNQRRASCSRSFLPQPRQIASSARTRR